MVREGTICKTKKAGIVAYVNSPTGKKRFAKSKSDVILRAYSLFFENDKFWVEVNLFGKPAYILCDDLKFIVQSEVDAAIEKFKEEKANNKFIQFLKLYQPKYAAFKLGEDKAYKYTIDDFNSFCRNFEKIHGGKLLRESSKGHNINTTLNFNNNNLRAILESDIAYISGHGFDGGVIPIYKNAFNAEGGNVGVKNYDKILSTDKHIGTDFNRYDGPTIALQNVFSLNMKDHKNANIDERLKWLITATCSQLSDLTTFSKKSSVERWIDVLKNNKKMKGVFGYTALAPNANALLSDDYVIRNFLLSTFYVPNESQFTVYGAWVVANTYKNLLNDDVFNTFARRTSGALLVKAGCEKEWLGQSLSKNEDVKYSEFYLYKIQQFPMPDEVVTYNTTNATGSITPTTTNLSATSKEQEKIEVTKEVFDENGKYLYKENVEVLNLNNGNTTAQI